MQHSSLEDLCRNIKRLHTVSSEVGFVPCIVVLWYLFLLHQADVGTILDSLPFVPPCLQNLDSSNSLYLHNTSSEHELEALRGKAAAVIAAANGVGHLHGPAHLHRNNNGSEAPRGPDSNSNDRGPIEEWPMSYEDANKILKQLYLERCARVATQPAPS